MVAPARQKILFRGILFSLVTLFLPAACYASQAGPQPQSADSAKAVGTIQEIGGGAITLKNDDGSETKVSVGETARVARIVPGQKDLKGATPITPAELQRGDRILVRGSASPDGKSILATRVLVMRKADLEAKQENERRDWQRRGVGGLVTAVDPESNTVTIAMPGFGGKKIVAVHAARNTIVRRYAPDSVKFDDAKISSLDQIKVGDQLRARGTRSPGGNELAAEEVVTGSFRNIAGTIAERNAGTNTIKVMDLALKRPVVVRLTAESQMRKLPPEMAQRIAMRLKIRESAAQAAARDDNASQSEASGANGNARHPSGMNSDGRHSSPDFQQMLSRLPPAKAEDFQKGEAVMIVSTEGGTTGAVTAITVLGGVEPILAAASEGAEPMRLSPWTLGSGAGEEAAQ